MPIVPLIRSTPCVAPRMFLHRSTGQQRSATDLEWAAPQVANHRDVNALGLRSTPLESASNSILVIGTEHSVSKPDIFISIWFKAGVSLCILPSPIPLLLALLLPVRSTSSATTDELNRGSHAYIVPSTYSVLRASQGKRQCQIINCSEHLEIKAPETISEC